MYKKYSKPLGDISSIKKNFLEENDKLIENILEINNKYEQQSPRLVCKACEKDLKPDRVDISKHGVNYQICENCFHLNGNKLDSESFVIFFIKNQQDQTIQLHTSQII